MVYPAAYPGTQEVSSLTNEREAKHERTSGHTREVLWTRRSNHKPLLRFPCQILTQKPHKRLLIGSARSKDLTCAPTGSFASRSFVSEETTGFQGTCSSDSCHIRSDPYPLSTQFTFHFSLNNPSIERFSYANNTIEVNSGPWIQCFRATRQTRHWNNSSHNYQF